MRGARLAILLAGIGAATFGSQAWADDPSPDGTWLVSDRVAIDVANCEGRLCGRVVWLRRPDLRTPAMCGRTIVWGLAPSGPATWTGGTFFDPENGATYNLSADLQPDGTLSARIYEGVALFGKTEILRRIAPRSLVGWC